MKTILSKMEIIFSMIRKHIQIALTLPFIFLFIPSQAQQTDPSKITIERLVDNSLSAKYFGPVTWLEGKSAYVVLEGAKEYYNGRMEFVMYDAENR